MTERAGRAQLKSDGSDTRRVFETEFAWVWRTLQRFGVRSSDLEDLTHDVFVVFHARRAEYDASRPIRPWLMGIALLVTVATGVDYLIRVLRVRRAAAGPDTAL